MTRTQLRRAAAVLGAVFVFLLAPPAFTRASEPGTYTAPKACNLDVMGGLCHVNHPLGVVPRVALCQPVIYAGGKPWVCSVVDLTSTGATIQANNLDGSPRRGWVRFGLVVFG